MWTEEEERGCMKRSGERVLGRCVPQRVAWWLLPTIRMVEVAWGLEESFPLGTWWKQQSLRATVTRVCLCSPPDNILL